MTNLQEQKWQFNARVKNAMHDFLRSKSWVEKVQSIERMNLANKAAKKAMREKLAKAAQSPSLEPDRSLPTT